MSIEFVIMGMLDNNVYIVDDGDACFVVDPTTEVRRIMKALDGRKPEAIVLTHAHWDHVGAAAELREATGATVIASAIDAPIIDGSKSLGENHKRFHYCQVDRTAEDGDTITIGSTDWQVLVTPGHTPGSMCLFADGGAEGGASGAPVLVAGDTLFNGAHGRTDFEGGDPAAMRTSLKRLAQLPENTIVLPGHNATTTIAREIDWLQRGGFGF